jgi:hypothetical protein
MATQRPRWSIRTVGGDGHLLIDEGLEVSLRMGNRIERFEAAPIRCVSTAEAWLELPEDARELDEDEIRRRAALAVPLEYYAGECLFSARLVAVLQGLRLENLQVFPVELVHPFSGRRWTDFHAVNVVGRVGRLGASALKVARDEESLTLLLDDEVKRALEALQLPYLRFDAQGGALP